MLIFDRRWRTAEESLGGGCSKNIQKSKKRGTLFVLWGKNGYRPENENEGSKPDEERDHTLQNVIGGGTPRNVSPSTREKRGVCI